jgi:hypothetical protein
VGVRLESDRAQMDHPPLTLRAAAALGQASGKEQQMSAAASGVAGTL